MSVYGDILTAVETLVSALSGFTTSGQVRVRKRLSFIAGKDPLPFVCICPLTERLEMGDTTFRKEKYDYPVIVAVIQESNLVLHNPAWQLDARQRIRKALRVTTLSGVSEVYDVVGYDPSPVFDVSAIDAAFDVSVQEFTYRASESRN